MSKSGLLYLPAAAFAGGVLLPVLLGHVLPPPIAQCPFAAIASSFVINLACLAMALARLPGKELAASRAPHFSGWLEAVLFILAAHAGMWISSRSFESPHVFMALAGLTAVQASAIFACHALLCAAWKKDLRVPRMLCAFLLAILASALFWSREPIQLMSKSGGNWPDYAPRVAEGVMRLSPPAAVAATWYQESDAARAPGPAARKFDLVHGPLTYAVWIGSYQAVAVPDVLPSNIELDFYKRGDFSPGIALQAFAWALPLLLLGDLLSRKKAAA